jgi:hypothetical protein
MTRLSGWTTLLEVENNATAIGERILDYKYMALGVYQMLEA